MILTVVHLLATSSERKNYNAYLPSARTLCLHFVCLLVSRVMQKLLNRFSQKFSGKLAHEPRKNLLDFGGNPDHITLRLELYS